MFEPVLWPHVVRSNGAVWMICFMCHLNNWDIFGVATTLEKSLHISLGVLVGREIGAQALGRSQGALHALRRSLGTEGWLGGEWN